MNSPEGEDPDNYMSLFAQEAIEEHRKETSWYPYKGLGRLLASIASERVLGPRPFLFEPPKNAFSAKIIAWKEKPG